MFLASRALVRPKAVQRVSLCAAVLTITAFLLWTTASCHSIGGGQLRRPERRPLWSTGALLFTAQCATPDFTGTRVYSYVLCPSKRPDLACLDTNFCVQ